MCIEGLGNRVLHVYLQDEWIKLPFLYFCKDNFEGVRIRLERNFYSYISMSVSTGSHKFLVFTERPCHVISAIPLRIFNTG